MNTNPGLSKKDRRDLYKMYEMKVPISEIARKFGISYPLTYYYLKRKGLITNVQKYKVDSNYKFNYKEYLDSLLEVCRRLKGMTKKQFKAYTKTEEGMNMVTRESVHYTPTVFQLIKRRNDERSDPAEGLD